ncbi:hypothetical protein AB0I84_35510, partial [Streptomyces spectabilis]
GTWRVWAEDETHGEAYIPFAATKRSRSKIILNEVARRFDGQVVYNASGGLSGWTGRPRGQRRGEPDMAGPRPRRPVADPNGVALTVHDGKMWIFMRTDSGVLRAATYTNDWTATHDVSGTNAIKLMDEPAATSHNNKLYVMYRR